MRKKYAIPLGAIGIAVIIGGIFLLTPSRPRFEVLPEVKGEGALGAYELWLNYENYFNVEVEVEGVLEDGGPPPGVLLLTQWVREAEDDYLVCVNCIGYEFPESFFMTHVRVRGIVELGVGEQGWHLSVEDAEYISPSPPGYPMII